MSGILERIFSKEVYGEIIERKYGSNTAPDETLAGLGVKYEVTGLVINGDDGIIHRGQLLGRSDSPKVGDKVRVRLKRFGIGWRDKEHSWKEILNYELLPNQA